jgi:cell division protein FtsQ
MATIVRPRRAPPPPRAEPPPLDLRLMNGTANALFVLAGLLLLGLALTGVSRLPAFELRGIRIEGDVAHNSEATIRANAAPRLAGNFFTIDLQAGQRAFETVPWVRHAVVRRVWPNRLVVALEEHRPAAFWAPLGTDANTADTLVNSHGEVFEANLGDVEDDALPTLSGPPGQSARMLELFNRMRPQFERLGRRVQTLELSGRGSWRAELDDGARIELGRGSHEELLARTERFVGTVAQLSSRYQRPVEYADLRHHEGYALRLKGVSTTLTAAEKAPGN